MEQWKCTMLNMLLLYLVDITDHEGLLSLLLGATDVPPQRPCQKETTTQPVHRDVQTERATERDLSEPHMPPDLPHQEAHPAAEEVQPATE